jgi:hypothetical protein
LHDQVCGMAIHMTFLAKVEQFSMGYVFFFFRNRICFLGMHMFYAKYSSVFPPFVIYNFKQQKSMFPLEFSEFVEGHIHI